MDCFEILILARKEQKITQKMMAKYLGITSATMWRYENKKRDISHKLIVKYAKLLGYKIQLIRES